MRFHLALERNYRLASDDEVDRLVVYFDEEPRHATYLELGRPYTVEKLAEGLENLARKLRECL